MIRKISLAWQRFWFESSSPEQMGLFRVLVGSVMFVAALLRTWDLEFFFSKTGIMQLSAIPEVMTDSRFRLSLFTLFPSISAIWIGHVLLLIALLLLIFGVFPRLMAATALVLHLSFIHRNVSIAYGVHVLTSYYLFYLCFADYRPRSTPIDLRKALGSVSFRMSQIQLCVVYAFAGLDKVRGSSWWRGDAAWMIFGVHQRSVVDMAWLGHFPAVIAFVTYVTLFWEVYFPVLVWFKPVGRRIAISVGLLVHTGIALSMGLFCFSALMMSSYVLFLDEDVVRNFRSAVSGRTEGQLC